MEARRSPSPRPAATPDLGQLEPRAGQHLPPLVQQAQMVQAQARGPGREGAAPPGTPPWWAFLRPWTPPRPPPVGLALPGTSHLGTPSPAPCFLPREGLSEGAAGRDRPAEDFHGWGRNESLSSGRPPLTTGALRDSETDLRGWGWRCKQGRPGRGRGAASQLTSAVVRNAAQALLLPPRINFESATRIHEAGPC